MLQQNTIVGLMFVMPDEIDHLSIVKPAVQLSRKCIQWYILVHSFLPFLIYFLPVLSRPSFTSRTPNKYQRTEQLFYFLLIQVP